VEGKEAFGIDYGKIEEEARFDGKWVLRSNWDQASAEELALRYKDLWQVEAIFRAAKTVMAWVSTPMGPRGDAPRGVSSAALRPGKGCVKNTALSATFHSPDVPSSMWAGIAASTGQACSHAPQSMHSTGLIYILRSPW